MFILWFYIVVGPNSGTLLALEFACFLDALYLQFFLLLELSFSLYVIFITFVFKASI